MLSVPASSCRHEGRGLEGLLWGWHASYTYSPTKSCLGTMKTAMQVSTFGAGYKVNRETMELNERLFHYHLGLKGNVWEKTLRFL